jgi:predicted 3-demethylubiquinone-9 3-methyltransferase (glyoxalase superfamily)
MNAPRNKIVPALWFHTVDGTMASVLNYYGQIFGEDFQPSQIFSLGKTPSGNAEMCEVSLFDHRYFFMTTSDEHHPFNDSIALMLSCKDQVEIDRMWNYFIREGKEFMCGWCSDKYGLRWQVLPENLSELMQKPNANDILRGQKKIVIAEF